MGFYRFYGRGYRNFIKYKIFYKYFLSERMQRFTLRKKVEGPKKIKVMRGLGWVLGYSTALCIVVCCSGVRGGGKCPEEEHST
jgi:hypothetical protein